MKKQAVTPGAVGLVLIASTLAAGALTPAAASERDRDPPPPIHYSGLINDYTPSAAVVKGGPYEMRGRWSLDLDLRRGTASFLAVLNMETSDYGIDQGTVNKDDPTTRGAHTHHISVEGTISNEEWSTSCPTFSPAVKGGFVITGSAFITGNGVAAPFGNPSPVTICVLGGDKVEFSNITVTFGAPANTHFGKQAIHGVVSHCDGPWGFASQECAVHE